MWISPPIARILSMGSMSAPVSLTNTRALQSFRQGSTNFDESQVRKRATYPSGAYMLGVWLIAFSMLPMPRRELCELSWSVSRMPMLVLLFALYPYRVILPSATYCNAVSLPAQVLIGAVLVRTTASATEQKPRTPEVFTWTGVAHAA